MILFDAPVPPDELTYAIRNIPVNAEFKLLNLFGMTYSASHEVRWGDIARRNRTARYRAFDGRIFVSDRDGASDKMVRLAPFSNSLNMGEYERLQVEFARLGGTNKAALVGAIYDDAGSLTRSMYARAEQALGTVLSTGKFTVNENGMYSEADFGVPNGTAGEQDHTVSAAVLWTNTATAKAGDDLRAWLLAYRTSNGFPPGRLLMAADTVPLLLQNAQIVGEVVGTASGRTMINRAELANWLTANGLPATIEEYDTSVDVDGVETRVVPKDYVIFLPPNPEQMLTFRFGLSATALELINSNRAELSFEDGPGIVGMVVKEGPPFREFTFVDAVGMPILSQARRLLIADVR